MAVSSWNAASSPIAITLQPFVVVIIDSLSDALSTTCILISSIISRYTSYNVDGWCGMMVSILIIYAGFKAATETVERIIGQPSDENFVTQIKTHVLSHKCIDGIYDLKVHDYGLGQKLVSLHVEGRRDVGTDALHESVDDITYELQTKFGIPVTIQMDFVVSDPAIL